MIMKENDIISTGENSQRFRIVKLNADGSADCVQVFSAEQLAGISVVAPPARPAPQPEQ